MRMVGWTEDFATLGCWVNVLEGMVQLIAASFSRYGQKMIEDHHGLNVVELRA
jgi:hypothetical protein